MLSDIPPQADSQLRYPELDALRGIAILLMVAFHLLFDLAYFYSWHIDVWGGGLKFFGHATAALFLLLSGICFTISWHRTEKGHGLAKALRRFAILSLCAGFISVLTYVSFSDAFIFFGILHLLAVSALLQPLLFRFHRWNALVGVVLMILPLLLSSLVEGCNPALLILGVHACIFTSLDYYPLLPWMGFGLLGMAIGSACYIPKRTSRLAIFDSLPYPSALAWTGQRSLVIYFLHQPILLLMIFVIRKLVQAFW